MIMTTTNNSVNMENKEMYYNSLLSFQPHLLGPRSAFYALRLADRDTSLHVE